ncbi:MAG TPA: ABC transporter ATP-binding protein/permease [Nevskiaceae bacterium]|nr:ABC transporter ATP-binding protein/permease [Nevskiaceae bacterium]
MPRPNKLPEAPDATEARITWASLRQLLPYLREFPGRIAVAAVLLIGAKLAAVVMPLLLKWLVDSLDASRQAVIVVPAALLLAYGFARFASVLFGELRDLVFSRVTERAMRRAALQVFQHLHRLDLEFHLTRRTGGLSRDIERGVAGISFLLRFLLFNIVPTLLEIALVAGILLVAYGPWFAIITAAAVVIYIYFSVVVTEWRTRFIREANQLDSRANTRAVDSLLNYETVKYFGNERHEAEAYDGFLAQWERAQQQNRMSLATLNAGQALIVAASITALMVLAAQGVRDGRLTLGDFVAVNAYLIQLFVPLNFLGFVYREIRRAMTDLSRMFGLLAIRPRVETAPGARSLETRLPRVRFEAVDFAYGPQRRILEGVNFEIAPGQTLAVVGASGAGKSTLARLLFRFYDVTGGRITIDGQDLRALDPDSLRRHIGVVPQDTVLFNDSLRYNLLYGRPEASEAELQAAIQAAHLEGFISRLPQGLDTPVGERGLKLSGGEKQRVAIARALLKDPPILIFDEATSALDSQAEQAILGAMREAARRRTVLTIAHRLSTITDADGILVLDHGRVVEQGTHRELLAAEGAYARLWRLQARAPAATDPLNR